MIHNVNCTDKKHFKNPDELNPTSKQAKKAAASVVSDKLKSFSDLLMSRNQEDQG